MPSSFFSIVSLLQFNEILGRGAFKIVYKGFDEVDGIEVAWNQVSMDDALQCPQNLQRLYSEVHLLRTLKHDNVMKLYDSWVDDENKTINMITELFTSGSLRRYRKKHKNVDMKAIKNWARQILLGLNYLHSQNPPIIHRDLKCDNIFVNGNHGEVKIGDLGLATVMLQPTARSVIGTPEFMAPELYDEEYNELVDIYSFGMCLLELVTCEYPYSECKNQAQIYKKVTLGIKPAALGKVQDIQVKELIDKCLALASQRPNAAELLKDSFLSCETPKDCPSVNHMQSANSTPKLMNNTTYDGDSRPMDVEPTPKDGLSDASEESNFRTCVSPLELLKCNGRNEFTLRGEKRDDCSISLTLRIADFYGRVRNIHFLFYLYADTATSIAREMVEQLGLLSEDVVIIADLIDSLISSIVPKWEPSLESLDQVNTFEQLSSSCTMEHESNSITRCELTQQDVSNEFISVEKVDCEQELCTHEASSVLGDREDKDFRVFDFSVLQTCMDPKKYAIDLSYGTIKESLTSNCSKKSGCECLMNSVLSYMDNGHGGDVMMSSASGICSSFSSSVCLNELDKEKDECTEEAELKLELNAIATQYDQCCHELLRMREEALENAKKRWSARKRMHV
ncbi:OLC1v1028882C3 [Oldenlandia corymbosa var. corymbosa]|uniref:non-specific serine/threonine protein kinase n=1 Tax=Oldenlandia corymbosa var. corymbosa TaxID=529605 RepID=A0AAV1CCS3_OLDCO|nr:OLC1v1028882C3 [Oldenlandia corymbosa var. corymbosa]